MLIGMGKCRLVYSAGERTQEKHGMMRKIVGFHRDEIETSESKRGKP